MAGEQRLLDTVIAKGRQENRASSSACMRLGEELASLQRQLQASTLARTMQTITPFILLRVANGEGKFVHLRPA